MLKKKRHIISDLKWFLIFSIPLNFFIEIFLIDKIDMGIDLKWASFFIPLIILLVLYKFKVITSINSLDELGLKFTGLNYWIIAPLFITGLNIISLCISYYLGFEQFELSKNIQESLTDLKWTGEFGRYLIIVLINALLGGLLMLPIFLASEIVWRGFVQTSLIMVYPPLKAFFLGALVWTLWIVIILIDRFSIFDKGVFILLVYCLVIGMALAIILQYFYLKSASIFVPALIISVFVNSQETLGCLLKIDSWRDINHCPIGLIGVVIFSLTAFILYQQIDWERHYSKK